MKADERRAQQNLLATWQKILSTLLKVGPVSGLQEDLDAYGEVKDYVLDRITDIEDRLERDRLNRRRKTHAIRDRIIVTGDGKSRLAGNGLPVRDNRTHNGQTAGADNG